MRQWYRATPSLVALLVVLIGLAMMPATSFAATTTIHRLQNPQVRGCIPGWVYTNVSILSEPIAPVGPTIKDYNGTNGTATETVISTISGTVTFTVNTSAKVNAGVIIANTEVTAGVSLSTSLTATIGNQWSFPVPAHKSGYAQYGIWEVVALGHYYYQTNTCGVSSDEGYIESTSPWYVGWNTWIGN